MPMAASRHKVEIPRVLYSELKERADREGVPVTYVLMGLIHSGKRFEEATRASLQRVYETSGELA